MERETEVALSLVLCDQIESVVIGGELLFFDLISKET